MKVVEFESVVRELEDVVIRIRAEPYDDVGDFTYRRRAKGRMTVRQWLETRIYPNTGDKIVEIIDRTGHRPHGATQLETVRYSCHPD